MKNRDPFFRVALLFFSAVVLFGSCRADDQISDPSDPVVGLKTPTLKLVKDFPFSRFRAVDVSYLVRFDLADKKPAREMVALTTDLDKEEIELELRKWLSENLVNEKLIEQIISGKPADEELDNERQIDIAITIDSGQSVIENRKYYSVALTATR